MSNPIRILVVDDELEVIGIIREILEIKGYSIDSTNNVQETQKYLTKQTPDLIILDLVLPDGDGYELCHQITNCNNTKDIPILLLSGKGSLDDNLQGILDDTRRFLTKPFTVEQLTKVAAELIQRSQHDAPL